MDKNSSFQNIDDLKNIFQEVNNEKYIPNPNTKKENILDFLKFLVDNDINIQLKLELIIKLIEIFGKNKELPLIYFDYNILIEKEKVVDEEEELNQNNEKIIEYEKVNLIQCLYYLYFKYKEEEQVKEKISDLLAIFIKNNLMKKDYIDYIFYKIGDEYSKNKIDNYEHAIDLLIVLFQNLNKEDSTNYKSYINLISENSNYIIKGITEKNPIFLEDGFCIEINFYLDNIEKNEIILMDIDLFLRGQGLLNLFKKKDNPKGPKKANQNLKIILSQNPKSLSFILDKKKKIELIKLNNININGWNKIQICLKGQYDTEQKYDKMIIGFFENEKDNFTFGSHMKIELGDRINTLKLFPNFIGKISDVLLIQKSIKNKINEEEIKNLYKSNKKVYAHFNPENNQNFEIYDLINNLKASIINNEENKICYNYIYNNQEYKRRIFELGGVQNLLPLYEILYKYHNQEAFEKDEKKIEIFNKLKTLSDIFFSEQGMYSDAANTHYFLILSIFFEKYKDVIFQNDTDLTIFSNFLNTIKSFKDYKNNSILFKEYLDFIILNPKIIMKLTNQQKFKLKKIIDENIKPILTEPLVIIPFFTYFIYKFKDKYDNGLYQIIKSLMLDKRSLVSEKVKYLFRLLSVQENNNNLKIPKDIFQLFSNNYFDATTYPLTDSIENISSFNKIYNKRIETLEHFLNKVHIKYLIKYLVYGDIEMKFIIIDFLRVLSFCYKETYEKIMKKSKGTLTDNDIRNIIHEKLLLQEISLNSNKKTEETINFFKYDDSDDEDSNKKDDLQKEKEELEKKIDNKIKKNEEEDNEINNENNNIDDFEIIKDEIKEDLKEEKNEEENNLKFIKNLNQNNSTDKFIGCLICKLYNLYVYLSLYKWLNKDYFLNLNENLNEIKPELINSYLKNMKESIERLRLSMSFLKHYKLKYGIKDFYDIYKEKNFILILSQMIYYCIILLDSKLLQKYKNDNIDKVIFIQNLNNIFLNLKLIFVDYYHYTKEDMPLYSILSNLIGFKYYDKKYNKRKSSIKFISTLLNEIFPFLFINPEKKKKGIFYDYNLILTEYLEIENIKLNEGEEEKINQKQKVENEKNNEESLKSIEKFIRHSMKLIDSKKSEYNFHEKLEKYIDSIFEKSERSILFDLININDNNKGNIYLNFLIGLTNYFIFNIKNNFIKDKNNNVLVYYQFFIFYSIMSVTFIPQLLKKNNINNSKFSMDYFYDILELNIYSIFFNLYDEEESMENKDQFIELSKILTRILREIELDYKLILEHIPDLKEHQITTILKNKKKTESNKIYDLIFRLKDLEDIKHDDRYSTILEEKRLEIIKNSLGEVAYYGKTKNNIKKPNFYDQIVGKISPLIQLDLKKLNHKIIIFENDLFFSLINREKRYRKTKRELFSWNNSYSNKELFYTHNKNLKYKLLNFMSKELGNPLLVPILDFKRYKPQFSSFDDKKKLFRRQCESKINVDLNIFEEEPLPKNIDEEKYSFICRYVKPYIHIKGKIIQYLRKTFFHFIHIKYEIEDDDINYDKDKKFFYGSYFNYDDKSMPFYTRINHSDIKFILLRTSYFLDIGIEIYCKNHKSYYFSFKNPQERQKFLDLLFSLTPPIKNIIRENGNTIGYIMKKKKKKEISSIDSIVKLWKNRTISSFEYLMWINFYSGRSYKDLGQYPIFPWIVTKYDIENLTVKDKRRKIDNIIRNLQIPMGMTLIEGEFEDGKSHRRKKGYIDVYNLMIKEFNNIYGKKYHLNLYQEDNYQAPNNLNLIYGDVEVDLSEIPYLFGSHFSNPAYVAHYLTRLFPYTFTGIEIQGDSFDAPDRLFLNIHKSFNSACSEKCDIRECIPEFFYMPEMFKNINGLNLGKVQNSGKEFTTVSEQNLLDKDKLNELYKNNENNNKLFTSFDVEDVFMPGWSDRSPEIFVYKIRRLFEGNKVNINDWIDLIYGVYQFGKEAAEKLNIYMAYSYEGTVQKRMNTFDEETRNIMIKLFELGVCPNKIFNKLSEKKDSDAHKKRNLLSLIFTCLKYQNKDNMINSLYACASNNDNNIEDIFLLNEDFSWIQTNLIQEKEIRYTFIKNDEKYSEKEKQFLNLKNIKNPLFKGLLKNKYLIISGYNDGSIIVTTQIRKIKKKDENNNETKEIYDKRQFIEIRNSNTLISQMDNSKITCIEKEQKNEKFLFFGTEKGSIIIYKNHSTEDLISITFVKLIHNHTKKINSIHCNTILNMFIDCSDDNYINLYTLPRFDFVRSYHFNNYKIDYIFLSSHSLPSFITISNTNNLIESYSINGTKITSKKIDEVNSENISEQINDIKDKNNNVICNQINSAIFISDAWFRDYIIYILNKKFIFVREIPLLEDIQSFNTGDNVLNFNMIIPSDNENEFKFYFISEDGRSFILFK